MGVYYISDFLSPNNTFSISGILHSKYNDKGKYCTYDGMVLIRYLFINIYILSLISSIKILL